MATNWPPLEIARLRAGLGLSQEKFAARLGVSMHTVHRWESGKAEPSPMAERLLDMLETHTQEK